MIQKSESALKRKNNFPTPCGYGTETNKPKQGKTESKEKNTSFRWFLTIFHALWVPGRASSHAGFGAPKSPWVTSNASATWELWGIYWWGKRTNRQHSKAPQLMGTSAQEIPRFCAPVPALPPATPDEKQGSYSATRPWRCPKTPPAPSLLRQPKGTNSFAPEQTNTVVTKPRAHLYSFPGSQSRGCRTSASLPTREVLGSSS